MIPIKGLVRDVVGGELIVKLETGEVARFQKRDGLEGGDRVLVGYDFENMKFGHIIRDEHSVFKEPNHPHSDPEEISEDLEERMTQEQMFGASPTGLVIGDVGGFEAFEALGLLEQDFEGVGSSDGE